MNSNNQTKSILNTIEEALVDIKEGKVIIVVDDEDRENEGDFVTATENITAETVNFMARYGRGLICAPLPKERCEKLKLDMMVSENTSLHATPFTISVDLLTRGCTTGISASDRAATLRALLDDDVALEEIGRPGHIFPLRAQDKGVLRRTGHTEAVVDLTRLAGLKAGGALVEIMNEDGTMARLPELLKIAKKFDLKIISIADLVKYRLKRETIIKRGVTANMPTEYGDFKIIPFIQESNGVEHLALVKGTWEEDEPILVRMHSSCMTGDIFASKKCDCGDQLHKSMQLIEEAGKGVVVYLSQEGRGIGIFNKIHAYKLQDEGLDTVEANVKLGFAPDSRDYGVGASILHSLGVTKMKLLTNNPLKRVGLEGYGLSISEIMPIIIEPNKYSERYLETKEFKMGHKLGFKK